MAQALELTVTAWSPLGGGLLTGRYGSDRERPGDQAKLASQASCATWDPYENPDPPGCDWFTRPPEPQ